MQLSTSLNLKQKQSLVMTPQLQQAIRLLQMTNLDLSQYLEAECFENPFLEVSGEEEVNSKEKNENKERIEKLKEASDSYETDNAIENGTSLKDDPTSNSDYENRFDNEITDYQNNNKGSKEDFDFLMSSVENNPISLQEHVYKQIELNFKKNNERIIAQAFTEYLEPSGWLNITLEEICEKCNIEIGLCEKVLSKLQLFEPAGLFARNLKECLYLQAVDKNCLSDNLEFLLNNLELLAKGQLDILQRKLKCSKSDLFEEIKVIRSFNPKPGEFYHQNLQQINAPDLIVKQKRDGWIVDLNKSNLPSIHVNKEYAEEMQKKANDEETKEYTSQAIASARWLKRAVAKRNSTTLKVGSEIIRRQTDFLEKGLDYLKPLSLKDIAEKVNMHESTISRVTSGLLINTPRGTFPLKSFFSISIDTDRPGIETSAAAVRNLIKNIISDENVAKPFSDEALAEIICEKGVKLARRTVAKYRELMKIPSSSERRRRAKVFGE